MKKQMSILFLVNILITGIIKPAVELAQDVTPKTTVIESDINFKTQELKDIASKPAFSFAFVPEEMCKNILLLDDLLKKKRKGIISPDFQNICSRVRSGCKSASYEDALKAVPDVLKWLKESKDIVGEPNCNPICYAFKKYNASLKSGEAGIIVQTAPVKPNCANTIIVHCNTSITTPANAVLDCEPMLSE